MAKLSLMFEEKMVKVVPVGSRPVRIGRSPDNDLVVDNLAVSNDHARVYFDSGRLVVEDRGSLNGTFVNDLRVERATLHDGDSIWIGKHHIKVDATGDASARAAPGGSSERLFGPPFGISARAPTIRNAASPTAKPGQFAAHRLPHEGWQNLSVYR